MDLTLTSEQQLLSAAARGFLRQHWDRHTVRSLEADSRAIGALLWKRVADLGWPGLALPTDVGGSGGGISDLCLLAEEFGRVAASSPLFVSTALGALPLSWAAPNEPARTWLARLASGDAVATMAVLEPGGHEWTLPRTTTQRTRGGVTLTGRKVLVPYGCDLQFLLIAAVIDDLPALLSVDPASPGVEITRQATLGGDPMVAIDLVDVAVEPDNIVARGPAAREIIERALDVLTVLQVSYAVGLCEGAIELSVAHAGAREQFGRPIGSFQAVAHRCVDMRTATDGARLLAQRAAFAIDRNGSASLDVAVAKSFANVAVRDTMAHAHQVHGAIGFSMECDLQLFSRRGKAFELTLGSTDFQLDRVAVGIGL